MINSSPAFDAKQDSDNPKRFDLVRDFITLTKPTIILMLLITAAGGMFLAAEGVPPIGIMILVLIAGSLAAGGANAINHQMDRDIDEIMGRTRNRPVAGHRISPSKALIFGIFLNVLAFGIFLIWVNLLAGLLTMTATLFYVFVYTKWLKRTTPQNIVIGGAAGAIPPLAGWAAVTGGLDLPAVYLFAIIFFWTPPHFWALALLIKRDYAEAGVPMLPVITTVGHTIQQIFYYTLVLVGLSVVFALTKAVGLIYLASALVLGGIYIWMAWRLSRHQTNSEAKKIYLYSLLYLALLFAAIMVDSAVHL